MIWGRGRGEAYRAGGHQADTGTRADADHVKARDKARPRAADRKRAQARRRRGATKRNVRLPQAAREHRRARRGREQAKRAERTFRQRRHAGASTVSLVTAMIDMHKQLAAARTGDEKTYGDMTGREVLVDEDPEQYSAIGCCVS